MVRLQLPGAGRTQPGRDIESIPVIYAPAPQPVPETIDYDMWIGPAPFRPYNSNRFHKQWRNYWDFGGGQQTDWVHYLDSAFDGLLALGYPRTYPKTVFSVGYKHPKTMTKTPRVQTSVFQFDKYHVVWEQQATNLYNRVDGVAWIAIISYRLGGKSLEYLPEDMKFRNNPEADLYIFPEYQNGWKFPKV